MSPLNFTVDCVMHIYSRPESRYIQQIALKVSPVQTNYSPDGRALLYTSAGHQLFFMTLGKESEEAKEQWSLSEKDGVRAVTSDYVIFSLIVIENLAHRGLDSHVQSCRGWSGYDPPPRTYPPHHGLSIANGPRKPCGPCGRMCSRCTGSSRKVCHCCTLSLGHTQELEH